MSKRKNRPGNPSQKIEDIFLPCPFSRPSEITARKKVQIGFIHEDNCSVGNKCILHMLKGGSFLFILVTVLHFRWFRQHFLHSDTASWPSSFRCTVVVDSMIWVSANISSLFSRRVNSSFSPTNDNIRCTKDSVTIWALLPPRCFRDPSAF